MAHACRAAVCCVHFTTLANSCMHMTRAHHHHLLDRGSMHTLVTPAEQLLWQLVKPLNSMTLSMSAYRSGNAGTSSPSRQAELQSADSPVLLQQKTLQVTAGKAGSPPVLGVDELLHWILVTAASQQHPSRLHQLCCRARLPCCTCCLPAGMLALW